MNGDEDKLAVVVGKVEDDVVICPTCRTLVKYTEDDIVITDKSGDVEFYKIICPNCKRSLIVDVKDMGK